MRSLDRCPKCRKLTLRMNVYLHVTAPASLYANLTKTALRRAGVSTRAALWETTSWFCVNPKCCFIERGTSEVRVVPRDFRIEQERLAGYRKGIAAALKAMAKHRDTYQSARAAVLRLRRMR